MSSQTVAYQNGSGVRTPVTAATPLPVSGVAALPTTALTTRVSGDKATSGDSTIVSGVASQTIKVWKMIISYAASPVTLLIKDGAGTTLLTVPLNTYGSMVLDFDGEPWFVTSAGNGLVFNLSAAVQIYGRVYFTQG